MGVSRFGSSLDSPARASALLRALARREGLELAPAGPGCLVSSAVGAGVWCALLDTDSLAEHERYGADAQDALMTLLGRAAGTLCLAGCPQLAQMRCPGVSSGPRRAPVLPETALSSLFSPVRGELLPLGDAEVAESLRVRLLREAEDAGRWSLQLLGPGAAAALSCAAADLRSAGSARFLFAADTLETVADHIGELG